MNTNPEYTLSQKRGQVAARRLVLEELRARAAPLERFLQVVEAALELANDFLYPEDFSRGVVARVERVHDYHSLAGGGVGEEREHVQHLVALLALVLANDLLRRVEVPEEREEVDQELGLVNSLVLMCVEAFDLVVSVQQHQEERVGAEPAGVGLV